jgi:hypothetical protein
MVVGLGSAVLIYKSAMNDSYGAWGYGVVDGNIYPILPGDSKMYRHNLEVMGGKLSVMMDDFSRWFGGLWHGKSLAIIIACITFIISFGFFKAANSMDRRLTSDAANENNPDETG